MLSRIHHYLIYDLWNFRLDEVKGFRWLRLKSLRAIYLAVHGFYSDKCALSASSLTYYTVMSLVPILAMGLAITRGFGYREKLKAELLLRFPDQNGILDQLFTYADKMIEEMKGGVVAGVGLAVLFLTIALLLSNLESILNHIWGVKNIRSWKRIFSDYFALMLIAPVFFVLASSVGVFVVEQVEIAILALPISRWAISWLLFSVNLIPYGLFWALFTFIYLFMPNTKVRFSSAAFGALIGSCLYLLVQWGYIYFQVGVTRYGAIYGSMAAVPLFLIWLQTSWLIFLFGAELASALQMLPLHEFENQAKRLSTHYKRIVSLWIARIAIERGMISLQMLSQEFRIPLALSKPLLQKLVDGNILYETKAGFAPSHRLFEMKLSEFIDSLDFHGDNSFPSIDSKAVLPFEKALERFRKSIETTTANIRVSHVSDPI